MAAQRSYVNTKYGVALKYASSYKLIEGELGTEDSLGYMGPIPMEFADSGGIRVVTVEVPPDTFPGTDFNIAFVTVSVNQHLPRSQCERFPDTISGIGTPIATKLGGIVFHGLEQGEAGMGHGFSGIYYHGFAGGSCYEIGKGLAVSGYGAVDGMKKVDEREVSKLLDDIQQSIRIDTRSTNARQR